MPAHYDFYIGMTVLGDAGLEHLKALDENPGTFMTKPELPPVAPIPIGRYRHYKGHEYEVLGVARHSETLEELVVYRALYGEKGLWVRPRAMFVESIEIEGKPVARFEYVGPMHA